jgi:hypothetical protein
VPTTSKPSFFSVEGQKQALSRVVGVFTAPFTGADIMLKNPITGTTYGNVTTPVNVATIVGSLGTAATIGALAAGTAGATAGTATAGGALSRAFTPTLATAGLFGLGAGVLFSSAGGSRTAPQTMTQTPTQPTTGTQTTTPNWTDSSTKILYQNRYDTIIGSPYASIAGSQSASQPSTQETTPIFSQNPSQDTSGSQGQEAGTGTNWALIAAIGLGAYFLLNKR